MYKSKYLSRPLPLFSLAAIAAFLFFGNSVPTQATGDTDAAGSVVKPACNNATLRGQFAFRGDGLVPGGPPPAPMVPFGVIGLMTFDGDGNLTNASTASNNGTILSGLRTGYYTIEEDCTGTLQVILPFPPFEINHSLVISEKGDSFYMIGTDPFSVVTFEAKRLR
ncbi:MAG TPA: hypothetical protein VK918_07685 [Pyrinomonadaceae bacterium]|nr:hypothetical protein [Pyrinomonadaceae bacterium]